jgi:hypothetical protein
MKVTLASYEQNSVHFVQRLLVTNLSIAGSRLSGSGGYEQNSVHFCATPSSDKFVNCRFPTVKAAVASYVQEVKLLANQLENLIRERDKLRLDIQVQYMTFSLFLLQMSCGRDIY